MVAGFVLGLHAEFSAPPQDVVRPLLIGVLAVGVVQAIVTLLLRNLTLGTFVTAVAAGSALGLWAIVGILLIIPAWWKAIAALRRRRRRPPPDRLPVPAMARFGATLAVLFLVLSVMRFASVFPAWSVRAAESPISLPGTRGPDIFVLMLDGYPRHDTLREDFGIDNSWFLDGLRGSGFEVDGDARSSYMKTWLSIASLLHLTLIQDIPALADPPSDFVAQYRVASAAVAEAPVASALRERGYEIISAPSAFTETSVTTADVILDSPGPTHFENHLMESTPIAGVLQALAPGALARAQLEQVEGTLSAVASVAAREADRPRLVIGHVMAPHVPFVVDAEGTPYPMPDCYPRSCSLWDHYRTTLRLDRETYARRLAGYLAYVNDRVLETVQSVILDRPEAIVIILSDHGARHDPDDIDEQFRTLFAARTPGRTGVFPAGMHPANVFRHLFNAYFGTDLEPIPYGAWASSPGLLDLVPWAVSED